MDLVKLENISKTYRTGSLEFQALNNVSFSVTTGEFLAVAGPSGSGKTTLLNLIGCLDSPTAGKLYLEDNDIGPKKSEELAYIRRCKLGFIFQTFNLIPILTAYENVEFPLILKGDTGPKERRVMIEEIMTEVGLKDLMHRKPVELSGGQQQRVAIARALVKKPQLILADEPTANLDSHTGQEILDIMVKLNEKSKATFIFSTHDKMVMDYARRIIRLKDGMFNADEARG
ncbi:MAG: ABC transporter ATP-binding protein [Candidatus Aminicenantes bacterium]|jgi:putative ABC transport system ATP-binding protein